MPVVTAGVCRILRGLLPWPFANDSREASTFMDSGLAAVVMFSVRVGACRLGGGVSGCELGYLSVSDSNRLHASKFQPVVDPCLLRVCRRFGISCCIVSTSWSIFAVMQVIVVFVVNE